jgi:SAM-dependent methyltransferase
MILQSDFDPAPYRPIPKFENCAFYHSLDFDDGSSVVGPWDIRGRFEQYIGNYPIAGKTMLDVGTATGFLTFAAEKAGAKVTALEGRSIAEYCQLHFSGLQYHEDRAAFVKQNEVWFETLKNGFWYCWHKMHSKAEVVYAPMTALPYWTRRFDVVLAGATLEHLSDPVSVIWSLTQLATEAVIIAFTPVIMDEAQFMATANDWNDPKNNFTWWSLSLGLYRRIFANVGFEIELVFATAVAGGVEHKRPTIIARRTSSAVLSFV